MYGGGVTRLVAERCGAECSVTRDIGLEGCRISVGVVVVESWQKRGSCRLVSWTSLALCPTPTTTTLRMVKQRSTTEERF